jgi:hypothetical protein
MKGKSISTIKESYGIKVHGRTAKKYYTKGKLKITAKDKQKKGKLKVRKKNAAKCSKEI